MNIKYFIFNLLAINSNFSDEYKLILENFEKAIQFTDKDLEQKFKERKEIYKEFFTEYIKKFNKSNKTFNERIEEIIFIREFLKKNKIKSRSLYKELNYSSCYKYIEYDYFDTSSYYGDFSRDYISLKIKEISQDSDEYAIFWIEKNSIEYALEDLKKENKKDKKEMKKDRKEINNMIKEVAKVSYPSSVKTNNINLKFNLKASENENKKDIDSKIKEVLEASSPNSSKITNIDLEITLGKFNQKIPSLKNDLDTIELLKDFQISACDENPIELLEFFIYMYEKYESYFDSPQELNKEIEFIKDFTSFAKENSADLELIYSTTKSINNTFFDYNVDDYSPKNNDRPEYLFEKIIKIDNEYYFYIIFNEYTYIVRKINNFKKLKKLEIIYGLATFKGIDYYSSTYCKILNSLFHEEKIYYF